LAVLLAPRQLHSPPQSPDLNIIEHVREILERKIRKHSISSAPMLKEGLQEEWAKITSEELGNLAASMPRRLQAVMGRCPWWSNKILTLFLKSIIYHISAKKVIVRTLLSVPILSF